MKSLFVFFFLLLGTIFCKSPGSRKDLNLEHRDENFLIYREIGNKINVPGYINEKSVKNFLSALQYTSGSQLFKETTSIFTDPEILESITKLIYGKLMEGDTFLIVLKKEDLINPYNRMYRFRFLIRVTEQGLLVDFFETNRNLIFLKQFELTDWAQPNNDIAYRDNPFPSLKPEIDLYTRKFPSEFCPDFPFQFLLTDEKKLTPELPGSSSSEERLKELEKLKKSKLITDEEYKLYREKILNEL